MLQWIESHILTILIFLPLFCSVLMLACKTNKNAQIIAIVGSLLNFVLSLHTWFHFDESSKDLQFVEIYSWIDSLGISYFTGLDGLNLLLLMLTTFLTPLVIISLWNSQQKQLKALISLLLVLESGMVGSLVAFDLVFFYIFWEVMLIPMYFIIGVWGGSNRIYATTKFVIYTVFGSLLMLIAALVIYFIHYKETGTYSTNLLDLYQISSMSLDTQIILFGAFALAFAIKVPVFPFHTWLPHAHTEAPTSGSVILAGILLKMGTYGFIRFAMPIFPKALVFYSPILLTLGVVGIIYGALMAWMQTDAKRLVAYSSVSHLGFVIIGSVALIQNQLSIEALTGAIYQMINHGISTGALFFLVGMIYERRHTRVLSDFGGLASVMPVFSICLIIATLGSVGLPGTGGFIGEFLILIGVFKANALVSIAAATGVVLGAIYMLKFCLEILFGPINNDENKKLQDLTKKEKIYIIPLCALIIILGIFPNYFLSRSKKSIEHLAVNISKYTLKELSSNSSKNKLHLNATSQIDKTTLNMRNKESN